MMGFTSFMSPSSRYCLSEEITYRAVVVLLHVLFPCMILSVCQMYMNSLFRSYDRQIAYSVCVEWLQ